MSDQASPARPGRLVRLTSLRGFAAFAVFVDHLNEHGIIGLQSFKGYVGVAFFFVLSGFVLTWSAHGNRIAAKIFYRNRFSRIYPSFLVMVGVAAVLPIDFARKTISGLFTNLFLVQAWTTPPHLLYGYNAVSWSLSCEAFFYATFPIAFLLLRRSRRTRWAVAGGYWAISGLLVFVLVSSGHYSIALYSDPAVRWGEFLIGMAAAMDMKEGHYPRIGLPESIGLTLIAIATGRWALYPEPDVICAIPFLLVIITAAKRDLDHRPGILTHRFLYYCGEVSFAFYLVHDLVLSNLETHIHLGTAGDIVVLFLISFAAAVALHHIIEVPFERQLRRGFQGKNVEFLFRGLLLNGKSPTLRTPAQAEARPAMFGEAVGAEVDSSRRA